MEQYGLMPLLVVWGLQLVQWYLHHEAGPETFGRVRVNAQTIRRIVMRPGNLIDESILSFFEILAVIVPMDFVKRYAGYITLLAFLSEVFLFLVNLGEGRNGRRIHRNRITHPFHCTKEFLKLCAHFWNLHAFETVNTVRVETSTFISYDTSAPRYGRFVKRAIPRLQL